MTIYCGVNFHARVQTVCYCDSSTGEVHVRDLHHQRDDVRAFYSSFKGEVIIGLEASGYSSWFEQMIKELSHIAQAGVQLERQAQGDEQVRLLRTHSGIGLLTSLCLLYTLEPVTRFSNSRKVVAYVA